MQNRYCLPSTLTWQGETHGLERAQLQRVILSAIGRAVEISAGKGAEMVAITPEIQTEVRESFAASRYRSDRDTYAIPSFNGGGAATEVPIETDITFEEEVVVAQPDLE